MKQIHRCQPLLGTFVELSLQADETEDYLLQLSQVVFAEIRRIHHMMSFHDVDSALTYINTHAYQHNCIISPDLQAVLALAISLSEKTKGSFDISVAPKLVQKNLLPDYHLDIDPTANWENIQLDKDHVRFSKKLQLDLGGIAKGYAVDRGLSLIPEHVRGIINAGGDVGMTHWQEETIEVRDPLNHQQSFHAIKMRAPAVATSAGYFNEDGEVAIMHPTKTDKALPLSATVFANTVMLADALTKVVFLQQDCTALLQGYSAQAFYVDGDGNQHWISQ